ncbi:MAG: Gfo/Idh/MocA family oxidoreductase [Chthoniobacterales bacterium]
MTKGFALVGLGFGQWVLKDFLTGAKADPFFKLQAVCDLDLDLAKRVAAEYGVRAESSLDRLLRDSTIEVIGLFTGPTGRAALIRKIVAAGRHVMTTKPFETDPAAADVLELAKERGCVVMMNSPQRPECRVDLTAISEWQVEFSLGEPIAVHSEVWASYCEKADGGWQDDPRTCPAAPLFRLSIYAINDLISLFGKVESVGVLTARRFTDRPTPDNACAQMKFLNGMLASFTSSFCVDDTEPYQSSLILHFQRGTIYRNMMRAVRGTPSKGVSLNLVCSQGGERRLAQMEIPISIGEYPWEVLYQAIAQKSQSFMPDTEVVAEGLRVIDAIRRSEQSGHTERVMRG